MPEMARGGSVLDDIANIARLAVVAGVGIVLLKPRPDGTSLLQALAGMVGTGLDLTGRGGAPGAAPAPAPPLPPNIASGNQFDFADSTGLLFSVFGGNFWGHVSVVHRGPGGSFRLLVQARSIGFLGLAGQGPWQTVVDQTLSVGDDADWAGYGNDVSFQLPADLRPTAVQVQASVYGLSGEHYQTRAVPLGPSR